MREILFRGKIKECDWTATIGKWMYGDLEKFGDDYWVGNMYEKYKVDENTVGQYTGLTDKYDEKIFEGDIIRFYDGPNGYEDGTIYWQNVNCRFAVKWDGGAIDKFNNFVAIHSEIIGNIFDGKDSDDDNDAEKSN